MFVLGPLAGLLVASRPATVREWAWIGAAGLWLGVSLAQPGGLAPQMLRAWALFVTGGLRRADVAGQRSVGFRSAARDRVGLGAATVWAWLLGTRLAGHPAGRGHAGLGILPPLLQQSSLGRGRLEELRSMWTRS